MAQAFEDSHISTLGGDRYLGTEGSICHLALILMTADETGSYLAVGEGVSH